MARFRKINFGPSTLQETVGQPRLRQLTRSAEAGLEGFNPEVLSATRDILARQASATPEAAGRLYLQTYLEDSGDEEAVAVTAPESPELVPDLQLEQVTAVPALAADNVAFQQTHKSIPIFSGRVTVDVDSSTRRLVAINGQLAPLPGLNPLETLSVRDALARLTAWSGTDISEALRTAILEARPQLEWYLDETTDAWHLVYHFKAIPFAPPDEAPHSEIVPAFADCSPLCLGHAPRAGGGRVDYLVSANTGEIVFYYGSAPHLDIPAPMLGEDAAGIVRNFFGLHGGGQFQLYDPLRNIKTFDLNFQDLDANPAPAIPGTPLSYASNNLGSNNAAAVAAHFNATLVFDFFNNVLKRNSVDDKGMTLVSVVNAYSSNQNGEPFPNWRNAVWWEKAMWYGQVSGNSLAEYLDVIGHELTHGVTETTSDLVYRDLPGALNESFSDIFGIFIRNWFPGGPEPLATWNWQIGVGLDSTGGPLRDFANPAATGQPDHFSQYQVLPFNQDSGGVHIYSGIHNRAAYLLMNATEPSGEPSFPLPELALLLYLTLTRLTPTSNFKDCRHTLENVVQSYYFSDPGKLAIRLGAVDRAYGAVGIV